MAENPILTLAEAYKSLRDQKADLEAQIKEIAAKIEEAEYQLSDLMAESDTPSFKHQGAQFSLVTKTRASAMAGVKDELYAALKVNGYGDLIYETVNANSLSSFVKEQIEENDDLLPGWLDGLVNVYDQTSVRVSKAR